MFKRGLIFLMLLFLPLYVDAKRSITYSDLDSEHDIAVDSLEFESVKFLDNSKTPIYKFGLIGDVENKSDKSVVLEIVIRYYTEDKVPITSETKKMEIGPSGAYEFILLRDAHIENSKYDVEDIGLYSVEFETENGSIKKENIIPSESGKYNEKDFVIDSYDILIDVRKDRTMKVTERFVVFSNGPYELNRVIPLDVELTKNNGMIYKSSSTVKDIISNKEYRKEFSDGNMILKFTKDDEVTETMVYELEYIYDSGRDPYRETDEIYFDILQNTYDAPIGNVTFKIVFPDDVDASAFDLSLRSENEDRGELYYTVRENVVEGYIDGILENSENIFLSHTFENGYFERDFKKDLVENYSVFMIPCIILLVAFILWLLFGKDRKTKEVYGSTLPKSLNSIDTALIYKGVVDSRDVLSILISLAEGGYIEISNIGKNGNASINNLKIIKKKEYDGKDEFEKLLLEILFYSKEANTREKLLKDNYIRGRATRRLKKNYPEIERKEILKSLEDSLSVILENANSKERYDKIYEKRATIIGKITHLLSYIIALSGIVIPVYHYAGSGYAVGTVFIVLLGGVSLELLMSEKLNKTLRRIAFCIFILVVIMFLYLPIGEALIHKTAYEAGVIFGLLVIVGIIEFVSIMPKRSEYGTNMLGKIDGFKKFVESSNEENFIDAYKDNPEYFYKILVHSNSIKLNDKWYKGFEGLIKKYPKWFKTNKKFELKTFYKDLSNIVVYLDKRVSVKKTPERDKK